MNQCVRDFQWNKFLTPSTDKHHSFDSEDYFLSGYLNVSHQKQFFSELRSPGRSTITEYEQKNTHLYTFSNTNFRYFFFTS